MVLQIRFGIWLTLQIEVEALHICKPSHHFASTISVSHVGLHPPALTRPQQGTSMDLNLSQLNSCSMAAIICRVLGWAGLVILCRLGG